jgi:hypothetical protein
MMQISKKNNNGVRLVLFAPPPAGNATRLKAIRLSLFIWLRRARGSCFMFMSLLSVRSVLLLAQSLCVHFLLAQKMNQKRAPEMITSAFFGKMP